MKTNGMRRCFTVRTRHFDFIISIKTAEAKLTVLAVCRKLRMPFMIDKLI